MSRAAGDKLGPFEIVGKLGAGGMGEVYRARDSKLKREVAIKVLPADVATDRERLARFQREAEVLASLNHPHIAQVYGIEENALVMELVEGEDLSQRIARGAVPIDEALPIARQIAEALEAAHDAGVVHRDLKPANIKIRDDGTAKVLDFGLAKAAPQDLKTPGPQDLSNSPTITSPAMTMHGVILGTAAYMSPEQAKGKAVDKRADIWAFGCVMFEMLTGKRAFKGDDVTDIITSVMRDDPDWSALPASTPASIHRLLRRCLEKDPRRRAGHMSIARLEIDDAMTSGGEALPGASTASGRRSVSYGTAAIIAASCIAIAAGGTWLAGRSSDPAKRPLIRTSFPLGDLNAMRFGVQRHLTAITPDSSAIATISNGVRLRRVDQLEWTALPNTAEATEVFASPDSRWFGFATRNAIWKVPVAGGSPTVIMQMTDTSNLGPHGVAWSDDGRIYFTDRDGIHAVADGGGTREPVAAGIDFGSVDALPARGGVLYSRGRAQTNPAIVMHSFDGREDATITEGVTPRFIAPDLLLFVRGSALMGARFDLAGRKLLSEPVRLVDGVAVLSTSAQYDVSADGTLVYLPSDAGIEGRSVLTLRQAGGSTSKLHDAVRAYSDPRLSPDGKQLALHLFDQDNDIWILDIGRGAMTRITFDPREDETPAWSPDGQWIAFAGSVRDSQARAVFRRRADGSGNEEILWQSPNHFHVTDWTPDGSSILIEVADPRQRSDIFVLDVATKTARPLIATPFSESSARVSPDGKWMAYLSEESGRGEIYVQSFPQLGQKTLISVGGAVQPLWSRDGRAIYFRSEKSFAAARIDLAGAAIQVAPPTTLFADTFLRPQAVNHTTYEVFPDGSVLVFAPLDDGVDTQGAVIAVFNWLDEVRATIHGK